MSLTKTITYLDDWDDIKKRAEERAEAAQKDADNKSVTKDFVNEKISEYEQKDKEQSEAAYDEINDRITHIVAGEGEYYTKEESDGKYATIENVPNKTSQLTNDSGFVTIADVSAGFQPKGEGGGSQDLSEYAKIADVSANFQPKGDYLTEHQDISCKADASTVFTKDETRAEIANQIATIVADAPEDFNTLKEIADYIAGDKTKASQIENSIADINTALSDKADADSVYNKDEVYTREQANELFQPKGETEDLSEYAKIVDVSANFQEKGDYLTANDVSTKANANEVYSITDADNTFLKQSDYNPQDLSEYAKIVDVSANFQEKGEYLTASDIEGKANVGDSYTKAEADSTFQPKGDYLTEHQDISGKIDSSLVYTKEQADELFQPKGETQDLSEYAKIVDVSANFQEKGEYLTASDITSKADVNAVYTIEQADNTFLKKEDAPVLDEYAKIVDVSANFQEKGEYLTASDITSKANVGDSYTKDESDNKYQEKGDYLTANDVSTKAEKSDVDTLKNNVWDNTNGYFKTVKDSTKGQAMLWNETDGGGAMFTQSNGVKSFAGVNNGEGEKGITAQIYTVDTTNGNKGPRVTLTENGAFYSKDVTNVTEDFEIATKGDLTGFATTDAVNAKADASVVYTKQETDNAIETQVANKIAEIVADAPKDFDTLKEVADYIASDKTKAAEIETAISNINSSLGTKANANEVYTVVEADEKFLTEHQDISGKADKSDVDALKSNVWNGSNENGFFKTTNDSERGQAMLWNETTGGGAMFSQNNGVKSFVGVNDGAGEKGITAQIYTVNTSDGNKGPRVTLTENGVFYSKDVTNVTEDFEIATKGDLSGFATTDAVNTKANVADVYDTSTADSIFLKKDEYTPVEPQDLSDYAKTVDVSANFQPKGNYLTEHQDISGKADADEVYTKNQADDKFLTASDITGKANTEDVYSKTDADAKFLTANDVSTKAEAEDVYTKTVADETFLKQSDYNPQDLSEYAKIVDVSANFQEKGEYLTASDIEGKANVGDSYNKAESDEKFQLKGEYLTAVDVSTKIDRSETETLIATEVAKIVSGAPEDFDTLKEVADYIASDKTKATEIENSISSINSSINIINASLENKANSADVYTMTVADEKFQPVGNYLTEHQDISGKIDSSLVYTKEQADELFQPKGETQDLSEYAKIVDVSANFQEKGDYLIAIDISTKVDASDVYNKTDIDNTINVINTSVNTLDASVQNIDNTIITINSSVNTLDASVRYLYINGSSSSGSGDSPVFQKEGQSGYVLNIENNAEGYYAFAEGTLTSASGLYSHAEGMGSMEGNWTEAKNVASHAEGIGTYAEGRGSHSEGVETTAHSNYSHAEGGWTHASGEASHAEGVNTQTTNRAEHASGEYNKSTEGTTLFSVGNGTDPYDNRKNAFEIAIDGSVYINGIGNYDGKNVTSAKNIQSVINTVNSSVNTLDASVRDLYINGSSSGSSGDSPIYQKEEQSGYVFGDNNDAYGTDSFAGGYYTETTNEAEQAFGQYNKSTEYVTKFSIGGGYDENRRKNIIEIDNNGKVFIDGIGGYNGTNIESSKSLSDLFIDVTDSANYLDFFNGSDAGSVTVETEYLFYDIADNDQVIDPQKTIITADTFVKVINTVLQLFKETVIDDLETRIANLESQNI